MAFEPPGRLVRALGEPSPGRDGAAAAAWLRALPDLLSDAAGQRGLDVERIVEPGGRSSLVALVRRPDGSPAALKLAPPDAGLAAEAAALAHWKGWGAVEPFGAEPDDDALLLGRLRAEVSLRSLPDARALLEAAGMLRRLWVEPPAGHGFESVAERSARDAAALRAGAEAAAAEAGAGVGALVEAALAARDDLCAGTGAEELLLHGVFRQGKVLAGERVPWLAVGPEPLVGERAYDLARLARDRVEDLVGSDSGASTARRRVGRLADSLDVDRDRLRGWTLFRAVEAGVRALSTGHRRAAELLLEFATWL